MTRGVLDRVVQQRGRERDVVEAEIGEDHRDAERVGDVRVARPAHLVLVGVAGDLVGVLDRASVSALRVPRRGTRRSSGRSADIDLRSMPPRQHGVTVSIHDCTGYYVRITA